MFFACVEIHGVVFRLSAGARNGPAEPLNPPDIGSPDAVPRASFHPRKKRRGASGFGVSWLRSSCRSYRSCLASCLRQTTFQVPSSRVRRGGPDRFVAWRAVFSVWERQSTGHQPTCLRDSGLSDGGAGNSFRGMHDAALATEGRRRMNAFLPGRSSLSRAFKNTRSPPSPYPRRVDNSFVGTCSPTIFFSILFFCSSKQRRLVYVLGERV